jgi:regulator of sigma E protease
MGGIIVNVLTAFLVYSMVLYVWGEKKIINASVKEGIAISDTLMYKVGFRDGDKITSVNNEPVTYFDDVLKKVLIGGETVQVLRDGKAVSFNMPIDILGQLSTKKIDKKGLLLLRMPSIVDSMDAKSIQMSNAFKAGILPNDKIVKLDSTAIAYWNQIAKYTDKLKDSATINVVVLRGEKELNFNVRLDANHRLGILPLGFDKVEKLGLLSFYNKQYGFFESIPAGINKSYEKLKDYFDQFSLIFKPSTGAYKGLGGFASMTQVFGTSWDWEAFWNITAFFSIALAFMNFLPIPMLDGGYILFTLIEMLTGKKVPDKFMEKANMIGFFIIIGLMVFTNGNDIFRKLMGWFQLSIINYQLFYRG